MHARRVPALFECVCGGRFACMRVCIICVLGAFTGQRRASGPGILGVCKRPLQPTLQPPPHLIFKGSKKIKTQGKTICFSIHRQCFRN